MDSGLDAAGALAMSVRLSPNRKASYAADIVAESAAMERCMKVVRSAAAASTAPVMLLGETGAGKRHLAHCLHEMSGRRARPCVELQCMEIPEGGMSARLQGAREARSGAPSPYPQLDAASGGSVVLCGLEHMSIGAQKELSGFLSRFDVYAEGNPRLGVRLLTTVHTGEDPRRRVFDEKLLNILSETLVRVPPLRERREDILPLARLYLERAAAEAGRGTREFSPGAADFLSHYDFPGNVSELRRLVTRAARFAQGRVIYLEDFGVDDAGGESRGERKPLSLSELERRHISRILIQTGWKPRAAARILGITETMLNRKIKLYGFEEEQ